MNVDTGLILAAIYGYGAADTDEEVRRPEAEQQELATEREMQRVAKTIIQALRSESDLLSEQVELD